MALFTQKVKKIKGSADKNNDFDGTYKRGIRIRLFWDESDVVSHGFIENPI